MKFLLKVDVNINAATINLRTLAFQVLFLLVPILMSCGSMPSANNSTTSGSVAQPIPSVPTVGGGFGFTSSMTSSRLAHTATMLLNGHVLIVGGGEGPDLIDGFFVVGGAELFDPSTGTFISAGTERRDLHTATLLGNGKVLLIGGETDWVGSPPVPNVSSGADLYDPATGVFQPTGNMATGRESHTATLLADGRVLVTGGARPQGLSWEYLKTAEIYDPASGSFSATGDMVNPRAFHTATLLSNGKVLVTGGNGGGVSAELYDPVTGSFAVTGSMSVARSLHTSTLLTSGKVLVVGGATAELYDPPTGLFTTVGPLITARSVHTATLLDDGTVLIAGGAGGAGFSPDTVTAEIYNPATASFARTGSMGNGRLWHTATRLQDGNVLVTGGATSSNGVHITALNTAEIWNPFGY